MIIRVMGLLIALLGATAAMAQTDYRVKPGDQLQVEVLEDTSLNRTVLVLPDGSISFPLAGAVAAGGQTTTQVASAVAAALAPNFATTPTVSVLVASLGASAATGSSRTTSVYLMGEVANPGMIEVRRGTSVLQALALSGGFTRFAATKRIQLRRTDARTGQQSVYTIDYKAIEDGSSNMGATVLAEGDVIIVPERRLFE